MAESSEPLGSKPIAKSPASLIRVVIISEGGVIQNVFASEPVDVEVVDLDELKEQMMKRDERDAYEERAVEGLEIVW